MAIMYRIGILLQPSMLIRHGLQQVAEKVGTRDVAEFNPCYQAGAPVHRCVADLQTANESGPQPEVSHKRKAPIATGTFANARATQALT